MQEENIVRRQYYQIYVEFERNPGIEKLFASVINALHPIEEIKVQSHQIVIYKDNRDIEVKVGYDPYIQVSTPFQNKTKAIFDEIMNEIKTLWDD